MIDQPISIVIEHPWFLVVNKPSGLLTQAVPGIDSLQTRLTEQLHRRAPEGATPFLGLPHRLDRGTSGAIVVARNQRALKRLCEQFAARKVTKIYHAVIAGIPVEPAARWVEFMRKIPDVARAELVSSEAPDGRQASLSYRVLSTKADSSGGALSLVEVELETGRMHQIRLQFSSRGHPIVGDTLYGSTILYGNLEPSDREQPIALHASRLSFRNPQNGEVVSVAAPYPEGWLF